MENIRAWILERHREEERQTYRAVYASRMAAAAAAPWSTADREPRPKVESSIERAVRLYSSLHYQEGCTIDDKDWTDDTALKEAQEKASLYLELVKKHTGDTIPDEIQKQRREDSALLKQMSHQLAGTLETEGFPAYRKEQYSLYHFFVHSNHIEKIPAFRRVIILPYIAAMTRATLLSSAENFVQNNPFCRFWTFTSGKRCTVLQVRDRVQKLHRRLSALNGQSFMKEAGIEIVLRSTELGTPEDGSEGSGGEIQFEAVEIQTDKNSEGLFPVSHGEQEPTFHPHAHCIVHLKKGQLPKRLWSNVLQSVWDYWGDQWHDGEIIEDARECLKYVTKPAEMLKLPPPILAELGRQLRRLKLAQPMGLLQEEIKARHDASPPRKLIRQSTPDGPVFREVIDWNRCDPSTKEERDREAAIRLDTGEPKAQTRVVARLLPAIGPYGVKEARMVILSNEALDVALLRQHAAIAPVIACSASEFFAGVAIRVHTCTPTVLPGLDPATFAAWKPPPCASIDEFLTGRRPIAAGKRQELEPGEEPREDAIVQVRVAPGRTRWALLGRSWISQGGTVRFDIRAGSGFRPGTSVDSRSILCGAFASEARS